MQNFYFTFGQAHFTINGTPMRQYHVKVTANNYGAARSLFCDQFAKPIMGMSDKWAFQYEEDRFNPEFFPAGEFEHITAAV